MTDSKGHKISGRGLIFIFIFTHTVGGGYVYKVCEWNDCHNNPRNDYNPNDRVKGP